MLTYKFDVQLQWTFITDSTNDLDEFRFKAYKKHNGVSGPSVSQFEINAEVSASCSNIVPISIHIIIDFPL